jgi:hypothetical protein
MTDGGWPTKKWQDGIQIGHRSSAIIGERKVFSRQSFFLPNSLLTYGKDQLLYVSIFYKP